MSYKKLFIGSFVILMAFITAFIIIPLCCGHSVGFLECYQFKLENIYYVFSILGVFATVSAVFVAIRIPSRIAQTQNKIALFEKRLELYKNISEFLMLQAGIEMGITEKEKYGEAMELSLKEEFKAIAVQRAIKRNTYIILNFTYEQTKSMEEFRGNFYLEIEAYVSQFRKICCEIEFLFGKQISTHFNDLINEYIYFAQHMDTYSFEQIKDMNNKFKVFNKNDITDITEQLKL